MKRGDGRVVTNLRPINSCGYGSLRSQGRQRVCSDQRAVQILAFALSAAANVRTLALVEVLFAQAVAYYSFKQPVSPRELSGIALIVIGVALLVAV